MLGRVAEGTTVTVTVNGEPVAEIVPPSGARRGYLPRHEVGRLIERQRRDAGLEADLNWISGGTTVELGPPG